MCSRNDSKYGRKKHVQLWKGITLNWITIKWWVLTYSQSLWIGQQQLIGEFYPTHKVIPKALGPHLIEQACKTLATHFSSSVSIHMNHLKQNFTKFVLFKLTYSVALVRKRTIPTEWPPFVGKVSANFCRQRVPRGQRDRSLRLYSRISRPSFI
jgi:hypothetical protein